MLIPIAILLFAPALAWAEEAGEGGAMKPEGPVEALAAVVLMAILVAGLGCALAVLRIIVPGPARAAENALEELGTGRLLLMGVLPLVGVMALGGAVGAAGVPALHWIFGLLVFIPAALLILLGALGGVPMLGARLLSRREDRSLLSRSVTGALVLGLAMASWVVPPLGALVSLAVAGWFLGAGLGAVFRRGMAATATAE
jgi:hypothetical protein